MLRSFTTVLCLLFVMTGCSSAPPTAMTAEKPVEPRQITPALLVMDKDSTLIGKPVSPSTFQSISSDAALDFGHHYSYTLSPDGKQIAIIIWPSGADNRNATLHLIDTTTWKDVKVGDVSIDGDVSQIIFSTDSKQIYWTQPSDLSISPSFRIVHYDIAEKRLTTVVELPKSTVPIALRILPDEKQMAVYGVPELNWKTLGHPSLYFIDLQKGSLTASLSLDGVRVGNIETEPETGQYDAPSFYYLRPGLAWDLKRQKLYIASADEEKITLVDLAAKKVEKQESIKPLRSFSERLHQWLMPSAQAKMATGAERQAVISSDGQYLFVSGMKQDLKPDEKGKQIYSEVPTGLQIISTSDFSEVDRLTLPVSQIALTSDGNHLLMTGSSIATEIEGMTEDARKGSGLYLFDTVKRTQTAHLLQGKTFYLRGFISDGNYAALSSYVGQPGKEAITIVDLASGKVLAERQADQWFIDVMPLRGRPTE